MTTSLLCETVTGQTMAELIAARDAALAVDAGRRPDMVELRLDGVRDLDVSAALRGCDVPVVVTCRPVWEGGRFAADEAERRAVLHQAVALGADYVDVEWRAGFTDVIAADPARIVVSSHDFAGVPDDLRDRVKAMRATGAAVVKVAVTPRRVSDTLVLREIAAAPRAVVIAMGERGVPTRLLASRFGSAWTYGGLAVAPGQMPAARMLRDFRFRDIGPSTALHGLVGAGAAAYAQAALRNAGFGAAGADAVCLPVPAADPGDLATFADALGFAALEPAP